MKEIVCLEEWKERRFGYVRSFERLYMIKIKRAGINKKLLIPARFGCNLDKVITTRMAFAIN